MHLGSHSWKLLEPIFKPRLPDTTDGVRNPTFTIQPPAQLLILLEVSYINIKKEMKSVESWVLGGAQQVH